MIRIAKLENTTELIFDKPLAFPEVPLDGFADSGQTLFYYLPQLYPDELTSKRLMPLYEGSLSPLQEALTYSSKLVREEVKDCNGTVVSDRTVYGWTNQKHMRIYLDYPSIDELEIIRNWVTKMLSDVEKGQKIREEARSNDNLGINL